MKRTKRLDDDYVVQRLRADARSLADSNWYDVRGFATKEKARHYAQSLHDRTGAMVRLMNNREAREYAARRRESFAARGLKVPEERDRSRRRHLRAGAPTFAQQKKVSRKIRLLREEGYPPKQAAAIAYRYAGVPPRKSGRSSRDRTTSTWKMTSPSRWHNPSFGLVAKRPDGWYGFTPGHHKIGPFSTAKEARYALGHAVVKKGGRDPSGGERVWQVWRKADEYDDGPTHVESFKDKGEAERKIRRLRASHPYAHYELRRRRTTARRTFGTRSHRRYQERGYRRRYE